MSTDRYTRLKTQRVRERQQKLIDAAVANVARAAQQLQQVQTTEEILSVFHAALPKGGTDAT